MIDIAKARDLLDHTVAPVVAALVELDPDMPDVMVVGAICRDALHTAAGRDPTLLRATDDLDLAVAVSGWGHFDTITGALEEAPGADTTIRYRIAGDHVDIVPFGEPVESPDGVVTPSRRAADPMSVFGFQDVWASAHRVQLDGGPTVRVPTVAGYTLLKLKAWADRSAYGEYKDANDLATAMSWYQEDQDVVDELFRTPEGNDLLIQTEFDVPEAAVLLLVSQARMLLTEERRAALSKVWQDIEDDVLGEQLINPALQGWPRRGDDRLSAYARAIRTVLV